MRIAEFMERPSTYPQAVRDIGQGYADGLNAYMEAHPDRVLTRRSWSSRRGVSRSGDP